MYFLNGESMHLYIHTKCFCHRLSSDLGLLVIIFTPNIQVYLKTRIGLMTEGFFAGNLLQKNDNLYEKFRVFLANTLIYFAA